MSFVQYSAVSVHHVTKPSRNALTTFKNLRVNSIINSQQNGAQLQVNQFVATDLNQINNNYNNDNIEQYIDNLCVNNENESNSQQSKSVTANDLSTNGFQCSIKNDQWINNLDYAISSSNEYYSTVESSINLNEGECKNLSSEINHHSKFTYNVINRKFATLSILNKTVFKKNFVFVYFETIIVFKNYVIYYTQFSYL